MNDSPTPSLIPGYITTTEAAARSGLDPQTIAHYLKPKTRGDITYPPKLRGIKFSSIWLIETASLDAYLASNPTPGPKTGSQRKRKQK